MNEGMKEREVAISIFACIMSMKICLSVLWLVYTVFASRASTNVFLNFYIITNPSFLHSFRVKKFCTFLFQ